MFRSIFVLWLLTWLFPKIDGNCAQDQTAWFPSTFEPGTTVNLFTNWKGVSVDEGFVVSLPSEWELMSATVVRQAYRHVSLNVKNLSGGQYLLSSVNPLQGTHDLILKILTQREDLIKNYSVSIAPAVKIGRMYVPDEGFVRQGLLRMAPQIESGWALGINENTGPLRLESRRFEVLQGSHGLEFWIRTTSINSVVLSTWDGVEHHPYPLELVTDVRGRMRYYRNTAGHHVTLATEAPIADGSWHHVALIHDNETYWTKLYLDGLIADSLRDPVGIHLNGIYPPVLGGRINSGENTSLNPLMGEIDDLRIWPLARKSSSLYGVPQMPEVEGGIVLDFESSHSFRFFENPGVRRFRIPGGPRIDPLIHGFHGIAFDQGIMLTWENEDPDANGFLIERSDDGIEFQELARVRRPLQGTRWSFTDRAPPSQVVFYRLMREVLGQTSPVVGIIKLGLGAEALLSGVEILGNYPNPFNPNTTINYQVNEPQHLQLSIINLSGHVVATLTDRHHEPGTYEENWDGAKLPSGTYFVRIHGQNGTVQTRQILLTK